MWAAQWQTADNHDRDVRKRYHLNQLRKNSNGLHNKSVTVADT